MQSGPKEFTNPMRQLHRFLISLLVIGVIDLVPVKAGSPENSETDIDQLKTAFIYNFTKYIIWPDRNQAKTFKIGVLGKSNIVAPLQELAEKKLANDKSIEVHRFKTIQDLQDSQILFISASEKEQIGAILSTLGNKPILTISDTPGFCERGIMINFFMQGDMVKFEMNPVKLESAGLKASSQLQKLARIVR
jgi:hypothetical protein